ncbi:helix-turn-helix domain-containing protein [Streptomyces sp. SID8352]|uniref:helix-turn-helix domain-containing protein n=1 Tax=Streptomyces sp. SID8352 TaxID=2690338 RepID=UPI00136B8E37|nr:helix-turn-helix domain-containing protein [Streptomyces sp. SID8352]
MPVEADPNAETFAQVLAELMVHYNASQSDVARAIEASPSTVSTWINGRKVPRDEAIRRLAQAFPQYSLTRLTAAAGRRAPAPLGPDAKARLLSVFDRLTQEQQEMLEIQAKALADSNKQLP